MTLFGQPKVKQGMPALLQQLTDICGPIQMGAVDAPRRDDLVCPIGGLYQDVVVEWADRLRGFAQLCRTGLAPCENIDDPKCAEPHHPCPSFAAFDSRVIAKRIGLRGVQHNVDETGPFFVPRPGQLISVGATGRKPRFRHCRFRSVMLGMKLCLTQAAPGPDEAYHL